MKFQCDRCKTRYSIADERIRGKILKIRCKNCSAVITVREKQEAGRSATTTGSSNAAAAPAGGTGGAELGSALERAFQNVMASPSGGAAGRRANASLGTSGEEMDWEDADTRAAGQPVALPPEEEWYISVDGGQDGPMPLAEACTRVAGKRPGQEMYAWREGFDDWLSIKDVAELAGYLPPEPRPRRATPPVSVPAFKGADGTAAKTDGHVASSRPSSALAALVADAVAEQGPDSVAARAAGGASGAAADDAPNDGIVSASEFDVEIGEASRVVRLPILPGLRSGLPTGLPSGTIGRITPRGGRGLPGVAEDVKASDGFPLAAGTGVIKTSRDLDANLGAALAVSLPRRKPHGVLILVCGGLAAACLVALLVVVLRGSSEDEYSEGSKTGTNRFLAEFYESGGFPGASRPIAAAGDEPDRAEQGSVPGKNVRKPGGATTSAAARPGAAPAKPTTQESGSTGESGTGVEGEKSDLLTDDVEEDLGPLGPDDIQKAYRSNQVGMKWCYEHALKEDPTLKVSRLDVTITVGTSGAVSSVSMPNQGSTLSSCLSDRIRRWRFRKSSEEFTTIFPLIFAQR
ncbi:MAG: GYF domain-containing protein [Pseudomonadota bacterium]